MSDDKAREYADKLLQHVHPDEPMECDASDLRQDIEQAYRAGYAEGHAAANRIVVINEGPLNAPRGLS